jgi:hypothetical protein
MQCVALVAVDNVQGNTSTYHQRQRFSPNDRAVSSAAEIHHRWTTWVLKILAAFIQQQVHTGILNEPVKVIWPRKPTAPQQRN